MAASSPTLALEHRGERPPPKKKAPIRPKPNECQDEGLKSSSEDELFWVARRNYARAMIRDWTKTPKRQDRNFLRVNAALANWPCATRRETIRSRKRAG